MVAPAAEESGASASGPKHRSRTDSLVSYSPSGAGEAGGSTFYTNKKGEINYVQLLKVRKQMMMMTRSCALLHCVPERKESSAPSSLLIAELFCCFFTRGLTCNCVSVSLAMQWHAMYV